MAKYINKDERNNVSYGFLLINFISLHPLESK